MIPTSLTDTEIAAAKTKAEGWSESNPFRARLLERLGGLHRAPRVADERTIQRTEPAVEIARDIAEALSTEGCRF